MKMKVLVGLGATLATGFGLGWAARSAPPGRPPASPSEDDCLVEAPEEAVRLAQPWHSLVHIPVDRQVNQTPEAVAAARLLLDHLDSGALAPVRAARVLYQLLEGMEDFGGEYSALGWLCDYLLADETTAAALAEGDDARRFLDHFGAHRWGALREYLLLRYGLFEGQGEQQLFLEELLRFNSPSRPAWERTDEVMDLVDLAPGMHVADIGSGPGFYTFRFSAAVGPAGKVYAVETNEDHLDYLAGVVEAEGMENVAPIATEGDFPDLPAGSLDRVFLCSTYAPISLYLTPAQRVAWLQAAATALKPDGLLVISDNEAVLPEDEILYRGVAVSRSLVQGQLEGMGFELAEARSFIPQRYVLVFRNARAVATYQ